MSDLQGLGVPARPGRQVIGGAMGRAAAPVGRQGCRRARPHERQQFRTAEDREGRGNGMVIVFLGHTAGGRTGAAITKVNRGR